MPLEKDSIPTALLDAYTAGKCGIFIGAGLSKGAGLPNWFELLEILIDRGENEGMMTNEKAVDCRKLAGNASKYLMLAEELREVLGSDFKTAIEEIFDEPNLKPTDTHRQLPLLKNNRFIITTNYDMLIEGAFAEAKMFRQGHKYYEAHAVQRDLYRRRFFLLKAHGDAQTAG